MNQTQEKKNEAVTPETAKQKRPTGNYIVNYTKSYSLKGQDKKWVVIDATDAPIGRLATQIANHLRGKTKPTYTPHADVGDFVVILNAEKAIFSKDKMQKKIYYHYTGWIGGMKEKVAQKIQEKKPEFLIFHAVKGMIPKTRLGRQLLTKLRIYAGPEMQHQSQKPEMIKFEK